MDVHEKVTHHSSSITAPGPEFEPELSFTDHHQSQNGENILLQLLEFKTRLLEVVEELHIRRDTEERFEEQISKLVVEKQELQWEKESLRHQIETNKNHHAESLSKANEQAKIRNIEEEKSRYQVSAGQKDEDIQNLKEELKSLQLLKYNLEKKLSELEQKLLLQSRSKDSHLNQLGEVEKRFSALSRQCAMVKQAHRTLEQNADEAMKRNKTLASANEKQEATIASLNKEVEELRNKLIKAKMSFVKHDETADNPSIKEQTIKELQQKLNMECEMNCKMKHENKALQAEKQEILKSMQTAHLLLSNQTQAASQLELHMDTLKQQYQSLEQDHKAMQGKEKAVEEKIKQLKEEYTVSKNNWDKEKTEFQDQLKNEQQKLVTVKEAYEELYQKHSELSSKANKQTELIHELKLKVKDLELNTYPNSTVEGGSRGHSSFETVSNNCVQTLTVSEDSDGSKDKEATITTGEYSETLTNLNRTDQLHKNSLSVNVLRETINTNSSTMDENVAAIISKSVPAEASVSCVTESRSSFMNSSLNKHSTSIEFNFTSTSVKPNMENLFQTMQPSEEHIKDDGAMIRNILEKGNRDGHTQENCAKENVPEKSANVPIEDRPLENEEDIEMIATLDDAMDTTMFIRENIAEEHGQIKIGGSLTGDRQSKATEATVDKKLPQTTEDTEKNSHVRPFMSENASECTSSMSGGVIQAPPIQEITKQEVLTSESEVCDDNSNVQCASPGQGPAAESPPSSACCDLEEKTDTESEESTRAELPETLNKSSLCQSRDDAAQLDGVSVQGSFKIQTQAVSPPDSPGHVKGAVDNNAKEYSPETEDVISPKNQTENTTLKMNFTDAAATTCDMSKDVTDGNENRCENEQVNIQQVHILDKSNFKCKQSNAQEKTEEKESRKEYVSCVQLSKSFTKDMSQSNERDLKTNSEAQSLSPEWSKNSNEADAKVNEEFTVPIKMTYKSSFEWCSAQRRAQTYMTKADMSAHNSLFTTFQMSPSNISGYSGHASATLPMSSRSKHNKVPLTITRATDLLNGSSVCGTAAAYSWRLQPTECKAIGEAHRDSAALMECRVSQSSSSLDSTFSSTILKRQEQKSRTLSPDGSGSLKAGWDKNCSQDTEDQQSSFREQIYKIEQFLSAERLRLPKRRKTETKD